MCKNSKDSFRFQKIEDKKPIDFIVWTIELYKRAPMKRD